MLLGKPVALLPNLFVPDVLMVEYLWKPAGSRRAEWSQRGIEQPSRCRGGEEGEKEEQYKRSGEEKVGVFKGSRRAGERERKSPVDSHCVTGIASRE